MSRRRRRAKRSSKSLALSATDADWAVVKAKAERRRLSTSRYVVALLVGRFDARDEPALVLCADEQREMLETVRAFRALMGDEAEAPSLIADIADMRTRVALLFDAWAVAMVRDDRREELRAILGARVDAANAERVFNRIVGARRSASTAADSQAGSTFQTGCAVRAGVALLADTSRAAPSHGSVRSSSRPRSRRLRESM